jgi:hypothetical protein
LFLAGIWHGLEVAVKRVLYQSLGLDEKAQAQWKEVGVL